MIQRYDPLREPNSEEWLEINGLEPIALVEDHHRNAGIRLPNTKAACNASRHRRRIRPRSAIKLRYEGRSSA